jgi:hypothetical protein
MVDQCANPHCCKPLHYLNEGRIYVFETRDRSTRSSAEEEACRREHFWLCGSCSQSMSLEKTPECAVRLVPREGKTLPLPFPVCPPRLGRTAARPE